MKRRRFLAGLVGSFTVAGAAASPAGSLADGTMRPMGKPRYLDESRATELNALRLALHRGKIPLEVWESIVSYVSAWKSLRDDAESAALFNSDPQYWLETRNIPKTVMDARDVEMRLLQAIYTHPNLKYIASDYRSFARYLTSQGLVDPSAPQRFSKRIAEAIRRNRSTVERTLRERGVPQRLDFANDVPIYELERMIGEVNGIAEITDATLVAVAAIPVAVYAILVIAISVGIEITVVLTVGVAIGLAVATSVYVQGPCEPWCDWENGMPPGGVALQRLLTLDEQLKRDLVSATRASYAVGRPEYAVQVLRDFIEAETRTVLEACEAEGLVALPGDPLVREKYLELSARIAGQMIAPAAEPLAAA